MVPLVCDMPDFARAVACACADASPFMRDMEIDWLYHLFTLYWHVHTCSDEGFKLIWEECSKPFSAKEYSWKIRDELLQKYLKTIIPPEVESEISIFDKDLWKKEKKRGINGRQIFV